MGIGFVQTELRYYALQMGTKDSAISSTILASALAGCVLLLMTANVFVALYAFCVILLIIGLVIGILGLIGWQLSIIESVIFACGVGMACDFVAHLGFAYRQANVNREASERTGLVEIAISRMMPAISAAALSTSVMGFLLTFSSTDFMAKYGTFILMLQAGSWLYATFCLLPILTLIGPTGMRGDLLACVPCVPGLSKLSYAMGSKAGAPAEVEQPQASSSASEA